ncbi:tripartite motif-containing protein 16-like, partial [Scomber japonicus]|uniref:tripartite motif-containing protein 16-like n=1 Tax=Scomber japonicus TaxID=13676 RepID=UPI0023056990
MAQRDQLDRESFSCSICLDLLKDPVTIPCGHSYCMSCIKGFWDGEDQRKIYSCPQCREAFTPRPVLKKNTMLAALVEQLKKTGHQAVPADHCYAGPEDVACDVCTGRKLKAFKSCLVCLASYCENHLQSHYESPTFKKHKLVEPSKKLQENICSRHDEVMKIFCRTDKKSICYLCTMEDHKGHDTVPAAAERTERQRELEVSRLNIQQRIQDREKDVKLLQQEVEAVSRSADKAVEDSEKIFTQLIRLLQKRSSDVKQQIRSQQETEVSGVKELQEKLQQDITELKRKDAELKQLSHTEDHNQFLHNYPSMSQLSEPTDSSSINIRPLRYFENVTAAVSELRDKLQDILRDKWTNISLAVTEVDVLLSEPEPKTRAEFLKYSCEITLDPNTVHTELLLSDENRKVEYKGQQSYSNHTDRFTDEWQVLSRESLTGHCYWEVEWRAGWGGVYVAVAYKNISRAGNESAFRCNDKSWSLYCGTDSYVFYFNNIETRVSGPGSSRVGVYLDHRAGILSFYSVSETMTLLHRVQTTFTQPLYAGFNVGLYSTAELYRFTYHYQVLSRESLTGRCYWEVERRGGRVRLAVAYKNISRAGSESIFGYNDKSWSLWCYTDRYEFYFNNIKTPVSGLVSSRVGVYLDHRAGILSFYSVSETMTLLHRVQTTFTQPLYAGLWVYGGSTAELLVGGWRAVMGPPGDELAAAETFRCETELILQLAVQSAVCVLQERTGHAGEDRTDSL